jgi:hypothetical protein
MERMLTRPKLTRRGLSKAAGCLLLAMTIVSAGCGTTKLSATARTATEQILLTNAWDDAVRKIDFRPLAGVPVYLDTQYLESIDKGWVISSLRQALVANGALLRQKPEDAQWIVEARVGAYGTDTYSWLVGVPQITVPTIPGSPIPGGGIPEIPLIKKSDQHAATKLALFAYERQSGKYVWRSGTTHASANAKDLYLGPIGPLQGGTIRKKNRFIGVNLPMISDPLPATDPAAAHSQIAVPGNDLPPAIEGAYPNLRGKP